MTKGVLTLVIGLALIGSGCGPNQRIINSSQEAANASTQSSNIAPALNSFERDLNAMRNADFRFIYVFRRRDNAPLDADDKTFVTATSPSEMNRRTLSDEGKALLIGSNFRMPTDVLDSFKLRFAFEDHSAPEFRQAANNSNQNVK